MKIINLETAVTQSNTPWPNKGIHYRVHPNNVEVLKSVNIDCCILSNNHVLDWGYAGLEETLDSLTSAGIKIVGAGRNLTEAQRPTVFEV